MDKEDSMNVWFGRTFLGSFDNSNWTQENGNVPWEDIGFEHINAYVEAGCPNRTSKQESTTAHPG